MTTDERHDAGAAVEVKQVPVIRVARLSGSVPRVDPDLISALVGPLFGEVGGRLAAHGVRPVGAPLSLYETRLDSPAVTVHAAFPVRADVDGLDGLEVVELPEVEVATLVHTGPPATLGRSWARLARWLAEQPGLVPGADTREVNLQVEPMDDPSAWVIECQWPFVRTP